MMSDEQWQVITGDCLEVMRGMDADSVDTIITDPPYGLSFMGKEWDHGVPGVHFWQEALRVAKPGAMMLAFGGTRTFHRLAVAIEDAGWELRDTIMWVYGSGFPKSANISKLLDKAAGAEREVIDTVPLNAPGGSIGATAYNNGNGRYYPLEPRTITAPATDAARQWDGWGTALKPAWEPILVAMKTLDGTFAANALRHGVAGLWVDGGRVGTNGEAVPVFTTSAGRKFEQSASQPERRTKQIGKSLSGRWPANVIHDGSDEVLAGFPVTGLSSGGRAGHTAAYQGGFKQEYYGDTKPGYGDTGSAARFFYCAKASRAERNAGLEGMEERRVHRYGERAHGPLPQQTPALGTIEGNHHPTVKPLALMRYLARLTKTPTGGVVLDPFAGSGSTGCAAVMEGRRFIGIEIDPGYADIARARIAMAAEQARQAELPL